MQNAHDYNFTRELRDMLSSCDDMVILNWLEFCEDLTVATERDYRTVLGEVLRGLRYVQKNFSADILQKSLRLYVPPTEIVNGAIRFREGLSVEAVQTLADNGHLEGGFIPL